ncbi:hypothetical protein ACFL45_05275 [Candidatus Neomarinimicrobiota bacterium]
MRHSSIPYRHGQGWAWVMSAALFLPVLVLGQLVTWTGMDSLFVEDFSHQYGTWLRQIADADSLETRLRFIDEQIEEAIITLYGQETGLFQDIHVQQAGQQARREVLLGGVARSQLVEEIPVAPEEVEAEYRYQNTILLARYLTLPDQFTAKEFRARWNTGEPFEALALQAAGTPGFMDQPGETGWRFPPRLDSLFARRAYDLTLGEISPPLKAGQEYQVIQLLGKEFRPDHGHFERVRHYQRIAAELRPRKITTTALQTLEDWAASLPFKWNRRGIRRILRAGILNGKMDEAVSDPKLVKLLEEVVFTISGKPYSLNWLRSTAVLLLPEERIPITNEEDLHALCRRLMMWVQLEELVATMPVADWLFSEADSMRTIVMLETVRDSIQALVLRQTIPVEDSLRSFLTLHEDQYRTPALINLSEIVIRDTILANTLRDSMINQGTDFGQLARHHTLREWARKLNGRLGWVPLQIYGPMAPALIAAAGRNPDNLVGPELVGGYAVLALPHAYRAANTPSFESLRPRLIEAWIGDHQEDLIAGWLQTMQREVYPVHVDTALVMRFQVDDMGAVTLPVIVISDSISFEPSPPDSILHMEPADSLVFPDSSLPPLEQLIPE